MMKNNLKPNPTLQRTPHRSAAEHCVSEMNFGPRIYTHETHDFYHEVATLFINLGSFNAAAESFANSSSTSIPNSPNHTLNLVGRIAHVHSPIHELLHGVIRNQWPDQLPLILSKALNNPVLSSGGIELQSAAIENMIVQLVGTMFLKFYERNSRHPKQAYTSNQKTWPEVWRFAWLLRNAIAHGDKWAIDDLSFPETTWRGAKVSSTDSGNPWFNINRYIGGGDVIFLMEDLNESL